MNPRKEERNKKVLARKRQGATYKALMQEFGLCQSRIFYIIKNQERWEKERTHE